MSHSPITPPLGRLLVAMDDDARRLLDGHVRDVMRMENVGHLASAMAHDFSNLLMVINGLGESLLERLPPEHPLRPDFIQLLDASHRAATLTTHLLAASRKPAGRPTVFDMDEALSGLRGLFERLLGTQVRVTFDLAPGSGKFISADRDQFEQVLLNLATNARDAMPQGGHFTLRSSVERPAADRAGDPPMVALALSDTGIGMPPDVRAHIFEPFFTTKPRGKGTGLGLWQAQAILAELHGSIDVRSEHARGTTFVLRLPLATVTAAPLVRANGH